MKDNQNDEKYHDMISPARRLKREEEELFQRNLANDVVNGLLLLVIACAAFLAVA